MPIDESRVGDIGRIQARVTHRMTADEHGNAGLQVLATPVLVELCERAAIKAVTRHLDGEEVSVGTVIELAHLAATPAGESVTVEAEIKAVDGRRIEFELKASDEHAVIGRGRHVRHVVTASRFHERLANRATTPPS